MISTGNITCLSEVFSIIPMTIVRQDMKINYSTLQRRVSRSDLLTVKDIYDLAKLFEVEPEAVFKLVMADMKHKIKK